MKLTSKYSRLLFIDRNVNDDIIAEQDRFLNEGLILQIEIEGRFIIIERVSPLDIPNYYEERDNKQSKSVAKDENLLYNGDDESLIADLKTVLNNDPFGNKHVGERLNDIYKNDKEWVSKALKEMKNEFIRSKLRHIREAEIEGLF